MAKFVFVIMLCGLATACTRNDTQTPKKWPRTIQPRLSTTDEWRPCSTTLAADRAVQSADCGTALDDDARCDLPFDAAEAAHMLAFRARCTDKVIEGLEPYRNDPAVGSDLAAAYFVRAQRDDEPAYLLNALEAAEDSLLADDTNKAARFNLALIEETLGLQEAAIQSWAKAIDDSDWGTEARAHYEALTRKRSANVSWKKNHDALLAALHAGDARAVATLIASFPSSAEDMLEQELLPDHVPEARLLAAAWKSRTGDPFLVDVVRAFEKNPEALRAGHIRFREATAARRSFDVNGARPRFAEASRILKSGGSPLWLHAELQTVIADFLLGGSSLTGRLTPLEQETQNRHYDYAHARLRFTRGLFLLYEAAYVDSLRAYSDAIRHYERIGDLENVAIAYGDRGSVYALAGEHDYAWRDAFVAMRHASHIVDAQRIHNLLGELADASRDLGHVRTALRYENVAIDFLNKELLQASPREVQKVARLRRNLAVAFRKRAELEILRGHASRGRNDLADALRLANETPDPSIKRLLESRIAEIRGHASLVAEPAAAVAAFSEAIEKTNAREFPTYLASLHAQRADALRRAGRNREAEQDLVTAINTIREEQALNLGVRVRGTNEELWGPYFARFQDTFQLLIRQLVQERRYAEAFRYAEEARAYEPLDLVRRLDNVAGFNALCGADGTIRLDALRKLLPVNTYLLEYAVLDEETYTWIVWRDGGILVRQRARRRDVERWAAALQQAAQARNADAFDGGLNAPYAELIAVPLAEILKRNGGLRPHLVIVPDGAMHGLPFAALRNPSTAPYLFEQAGLELAPSATLYAYARLRDAALPRKDRNVFAVGNPTVSNGLPPLRHAQYEANRVGDLYKGHAVVRTGADATIRELEQSIRAAAIVHVAAHTVIDPRTPSRSALMLAPEPGSDGVLHADELLTRLKPEHTRLFVLSTCSSAGGRPVGPEGMGPLVRPFLTAGVPAVIGTLWDVDDATAEELMVSFHTYYAAGHDAATALQEAQKSLLHGNGPERTRALAWSAFQVIGHASSPYASTQRNDNQKEKPP